MTISAVHYPRLVVVAALLFVSGVRVATADDPPIHRVHVAGAVKSSTFTAEIDGQKFATPAALEGYLSSLPAGSVVRWPPELYNAISLSEDDMWRLFVYHRKLKEFCLAHGLVFH